MKISQKKQQNNYIITWLHVITATNAVLEMTVVEMTFFHFWQYSILYLNDVQFKYMYLLCNCMYTY